ncbi:methyltransferase domain-containing protein [Flexithrix dorotheae]|uniref:methyltransferase domain-containing protein n=1 Tax=Flexithrix dorotheae TaxID=70993 RepID=UPI0003801535|nr:methyltransferase domain-containing protein [Flexithrix dorotheae]
MEKPLDEFFWENKYKNNNTGWDLGEISTPLKCYFDQIKAKDLKILIPGAGNAYEAKYLFNEGFNHVTVLDIAKAPIDNLFRSCPKFPKSHVHQGDFFEFEENGFDLIIEQTFFCALNPKLRENYIYKMKELLKPGGKLVGVLFNIPLYEDHPPFGGNREDYLPLFKNAFKINVFEICYNSIPPRAGNELFINVEKPKG